MKIEEAKKARDNNLYVCHIEEPELIGIITCFDDDETGFYYKPIGRGYTPIFAKLEDMKLEKD